MCARVTSIYMEFTFTLDQNRNLSFHLSKKSIVVILWSAKKYSIIEKRTYVLLRKY